MKISLSQRIRRIKPSPTIALDTRAKEMKAKGIDVISFGAGEPDFETPGKIKQAAIEALQKGATKYTAVAGIPELRRAIADKLKRDNGLTYSPDEIMVSVGGKHALYNAFQVLLDPGDEVIIPAPYWVSYPDQVLLSEGKPVIVETSEKDGFLVRPEALEAAITKKTKIFVLNSPSNPSGAAYPRDRLEAIAKILTRHQVLCLSDEIYDKIVYDDFRFTSFPSLGEEAKARTILINGASKVYSMTGWRMGYAAGPREVIQAMTKLQGQVTTNINAATQWACVAAFSGADDHLKEWLPEFKRRRDFIVEALNKTPGVSCLKPSGAFYVFPNISSYFGRKFDGKVIHGSDDLSEYLLEKALVAVVPGSGFGTEGHIRLSFATSMENIEEGMKRLTEALKSLSPSPS